MHSKLLRFQCKAVTPKNGKLEIPLRKCGPNYRIKYQEEMFDFFAVYDLVNDALYVVPSSVLREYDNVFTLRLDDKGNRASLYLVEEVLKDYIGPRSAIGSARHF